MDRAVMWEYNNVTHVVKLEFDVEEDIFYNYLIWK